MNCKCNPYFPQKNYSLLSVTSPYGAKILNLNFTHKILLKFHWKKLVTAYEVKRWQFSPSYGPILMKMKNKIMARRKSK